jgi:nitrogen regulatory protein P-II 1
MMSLRYVVAFVRSNVLDALEKKLISIGIRGMTVTRVKGLGEYAEFHSRDWLSEHEKVEIFTEESKVDAITKAIMDVAHTGDRGDGIVTVMPVDKFYRIRTRSEAVPDEP